MMLFLWGMLIGSILGAVFKWLDCRSDYGYRGFGRHRKLSVTPDDPKFCLGVKTGVFAGYWAATGEEKTYEEIVEIYLSKIKGEGLENNQ